MTISVVSVFVAAAAPRSRIPSRSLFVLPLVVVLLRSVWQRGWVVPDDVAPTTIAASASARPSEPLSEWLWDRSEFWRTVGWAIVGFCGITVFLYVEEPIARFVVLVTAVVSAAAWIWRKVEGDR